MAEAAWPARVALIVALLLGVGFASRAVGDDENGRVAVGPKTVRVLVLGGEGGAGRAPHGGSTPAMRALLAAAGNDGMGAGTPNALDGTLALGWTLGSLGDARRLDLEAEHVRALHQQLGAAAVVLGGRDLASPALAAHWDGEGARGRPAPPLNVLLASAHPAAARDGWVDVEVGGIPLRVLAVAGPREAEALRDAGLARASIASATALQGVPAAPDRIWIGSLFAEAPDESAAVAEALSQLGPALVVDFGSPRVPGRVEPRTPSTPALVVPAGGAGDESLILELVRRGPGEFAIGWTWAPTVHAERHQNSEASPADALAKFAGALAWGEQEALLYGERLRSAELVSSSPVAPQGRARYVGSAVCAWCHEAIHREFIAGAHARLSNGWAAAQGEFDPTCLPCHVTGWDVVEGIPVRSSSGWLGNERTPWLGEVGCEACHGPASEHLHAPQTRGLLVAKPPRSRCLACHGPQYDAALAALDDAAWQAAGHPSVPQELRTRVPDDWRERWQMAAPADGSR